MEMYRIMKQTRRNKRRGRDSVAFEVNWVPLLVRAMDARRDRTLRISRNYAFLAPRPRWREIFATEFGGRMIDHEICEIVIPECEKILSAYTFNNRKGMGSQAAINQLLEHINEATEGYTREARIVKIDFKGYFPNAIWSIAEDLIDGVIDRTNLSEERKAYLKWLTMVSVHCNPAAHCELRTPARLWCEHIDPEKSILLKPEGVGAAIGRLVWQTAMGLYINDEIRWLTEEMGIRLVCFVDDIVMVVPEHVHGYALALIPELRRRLALKGVRLNEKKFYEGEIKNYEGQLKNVKKQYETIQKMSDVSSVAIQEQLSILKNVEQECNDRKAHAAEMVEKIANEDEKGLDNNYELLSQYLIEINDKTTRLDNLSVQSKSQMAMVKAQMKNIKDQIKATSKK